LRRKYLVAGIPATPLVLALYLPWRLGVARPYDARLINRVQLVALVVAAVGRVAWYGFLVSFVFPRLLSYDRSMISTIIIYTLTVSSLALAAGVLFRPYEDPSHFNVFGRRRHNIIGRSDRPLVARIDATFVLICYCLVFFYLFFGINLYVSQIYPHLPQELRGAQPACADLVIDTNRAQKPLLVVRRSPCSNGWASGSIRRERYVSATASCAIVIQWRQVGYLRHGEPMTHIL
jgi:hypothetical protein